MIGLVPTVGRPVTASQDDLRSQRPRPEELIGPSRFVNSGTAALALAIQDAIERTGTRGYAQAILPAYCCPSILSAVRYAGAEPVLVDFQPDTPWLRLEMVSASLTDKTAAIIAVNFLGIPERLKQLYEMTTAQGCYLIDDSCQSLPASPLLAESWDYRALSFGRGKPVTLLHGGALQTASHRVPEMAISSEENPHSKSVELYFRAKRAVFQISRSPFVFSLLHKAGLAGGTRYAPLTTIKPMQHYPLSLLSFGIAQHRNSTLRVQERIRDWLRRHPGVFVDLMSHASSAESLRLLRYPLLACSRAARDQLIRRFRSVGICASPLYGDPLMNIKGTGLAVPANTCPAAHRFSRKLITLPLHSDISDAIVDKMLCVLEADSSQLC